MQRDNWLAAYLLLFVVLFSTLLPCSDAQTPACSCHLNNGKGKGAFDGCLSSNSKGNKVCKNGFGTWSCIPSTGCSVGNFGGPARTNGYFTQIFYMEPVPRWSYIYECQNATLFMAVYNMSHRGYDTDLTSKNIYFNTVTCVTTVPAGAAAGIFDVSTYNSCDNAGACSNCGGCNCSCRVDSPWWWNCCYDPCFACPRCCTCQTSWPGDARNRWTSNWFDSGSCLQCQNDGWCGTPNGQLVTPTVCQFALAAISPNNRLDYESLASSNFTYQVRILQRNIGCQACDAQALANLTVYVKDCNEWPVFDTQISSTSIYQYDGTSGVFSGPALYILVSDPDVFNITFSTIDLDIERVILTNVGQVNSVPWYINNTHFIQHNDNNSMLMYDASRCGSGKQLCLDLFRYTYSGAVTPVFTVYVTAHDGGGAISTYSYSVTVLNTPTVPTWVNMPATVTIYEGTAGVMQLYPMQAIVPSFSGLNTLTWSVVFVDPPVDFSSFQYIDTAACNPAAATAVQCMGLRLSASVLTTTLVWATQKTYNVTIWLSNKVSGNINTFTISSSVIINILQLVYQPTITPSSATVWVNENVTGKACIYNITGISSANNHTFFLYTMGISTAHNALYNNQTAICYDSSRQTIGTGTTVGWTFNHALVTSYTITITVSDPYSTMTPNAFTLTLNIVDVEDPPTLTCPVYQNVPETSTTWTVVVSCTKEVNMPALTFKLINQNSANNNTMFFITTQNAAYAATTGSATIVANPNIVTSPMFNYTKCPIIYLDIILYDTAYSLSCQIAFFIQRINTAPYFLNLPNRTSIAEAITGYVTIFTVSVSDRESDPRFIKFCSSSSATMSSYDPSGKFYLDPNIMVLTTYIPTGFTGFNFYTQPIYTLTICAVDIPPSVYTPATSTSTIIIYIVLNQTAPTWVTPVAGASAAGATVSINENVTGQKYIFTLTATDRESDYVYYNITDIRPVWNTALRIPWPSNLLEYNQNYATTTPMFNNAKYPVYYVVIQASDQKTTPTSTTTITVSVLHVDVCAAWSSLPALATVREDVYWGPTDLVTVGAIDPNGKYTVTINYQYISPSSGSTKLYYNTTTQTVGYNFNPQFAYGVVQTYTLVFTATNTICTITSSVVVQVNKVPTGPDLNTTGTVWIHENTTYGVTLWDMRAKDNNSLTLQYGMLDVNPTTGFTKFYVTSNGIIRSIDKPQFNYHKVPVYIVRATVTNSYNLANTFTLTVSIIDDPEPPVITNMPSFASVKEGTTGTVLGGLFTTKCVDEDSRTLYYTCNVLPNTGFSYFNVTSAGVVQTTSYSAFSYTDQPFYYVVVFCSNTYYTTSGTLTVVVVWTTSSTSTTPSPWTTQPDSVTTTTQATAGDVLTPEQIGAICGSLLGAVALAGAAWGIARYLQRKSRMDGTLDKVKKPYKQFATYR